ncbi:MAG: KEOPS complex kinase/ATPase Bud32 [Candidatus Woesearchaeota archaeon]
MDSIISSGAEAVIYKKDNSILKKRVSKSYRISEIDIPIRKYRTRKEAKLLEKLKDIIPVPGVINSDDTDMIIEMEHISGKKIRDILDKNNYLKISKIIGKQIALMHDKDIIHGDLTTSNFILSDKNIYFVDFGLGFVSKKSEDKAVDLHLLRQALESKHHVICKRSFSTILKEYEKNYPDSKDILKRLEKVEERGRNKRK